jgi:hypothetical protein
MDMIIQNGGLTEYTKPYCSNCNYRIVNYIRAYNGYDCKIPSIDDFKGIYNKDYKFEGLYLTDDPSYIFDFETGKPLPFNKNQELNVLLIKESSYLEEALPAEEAPADSTKVEEKKEEKKK